MPGNGNTPVAKAKKQGDLSGNSKGGTHPSDFSGNTTTTPTELRPGVGQGGDFATSGSAKPSKMGGEPRRSHS